MDLSEGRGGQMLFFKMRKGFGDADAEFAGDDFFHLLVWEGFDLVLQRASASDKVPAKDRRGRKAIGRT